MNQSSSRQCGACGEELESGASFCRACGTRYEEPHCGACQAPVVPGTAFCRSCGAAVGAGAAAPPAPEQTLVRPAAPPPRGPRRLPLVIAAAILLLGAGAAAAIVLAKGGSDSSTTTVAANAEATAEEEAVEPGGEEGFPAVSRPEMEAEIASLLTAYHEDVVERDFRSAWVLLSARKRQQDLSEYGYRDWMKAQASLSDYLSPSGLQAQVDSLEGEGTARVLVAGMGWSAPGSTCEEWSGLTWVKYERGAWAYDPGYSTTPARRRAWKPRAGELLGADC